MLDLGDSETGVRGGDVRLFQELKSQPTDLDQRGPIERHVAVLDLQLAGDVAGQAVGAGAAEIGFVHARPTHRQGQGHERVTQGGRDVQRRRQRVAGRAVERGAVREHAARASQRQLAELQQRLVDRDLQESVAVRAQDSRALLELRLQVPVVLLEVLGLEERALGPDDPIVPGHGRLT